MQGQGSLWWSSGYDSVLSLSRVQIQFLVWELTSSKPHGIAKKEAKLKGWIKYIHTNTNHKKAEVILI